MRSRGPRDQFSSVSSKQSTTRGCEQGSWDGHHLVLSFQKGTLAVQMDGRREREARTDMPEGVRARWRCGMDPWQDGGKGFARYEMLWRPKSSLGRRGDEGRKGEEGSRTALSFLGLGAATD